MDVLSFALHRKVSPLKKRLAVYVDGFNVYYGIRGTPYRWLDLGRLSGLLVPNVELVRIRYFTARITNRPDDPAQAQRQDTYLRALRTLPNLTIHEGRFLASEVRMALVNPPAHGAKTVLVHKTEEKGSDVNLATFLLVDGFRGEYEEAAVISNDTDLREPIAFTCKELGLPVTVLNPRVKYSVTMAQCATSYRRISLASFKAAQFPAVLSDATGEIRRPPGWENPSPNAHIRT